MVVSGARGAVSSQVVGVLCAVYEFKEEFTVLVGAM